MATITTLAQLTLEKAEDAFHNGTIAADEYEAYRRAWAVSHPASSHSTNWRYPSVLDGVEETAMAILDALRIDYVMLCVDGGGVAAYAPADIDAAAARAQRIKASDPGLLVSIVF